MKENIIVAGGINIDIKGFPFAKAIPGDSNPGRVSNAAGGVGRNIAENLARLGTRVRLCGAVGEDTQGRFILESCEKSGIDTSLVIRSARQPSGCYLSILDEKGELVMAVADMSATESLTCEVSASWFRSIEEAALLIIDANLPTPLIKELVTRAEAAGVPVAADPVSVSKAIRLSPYLSKIRWLFPNRDEWQALFPGTPIGQREHGIPRCGCVVTLGSNGAALLPPPDLAIEPFPMGALPTVVHDVGGAGDAFAAGFCYALISEENSVGETEAGLRRALITGLAAASLTLESDLSVSPKMNVSSLKERIDETH
ncbi:carbohydrate kinase family protein [Sediminispirochaeta smaragdinae]|uniref:PfkB domain protein n=1 Tax=Sediminispirochaeta smaragdinae (strain DSM 11293 / JCM 15392 / SEBR 4228) TaxID=573413 RepID=E1R958_SEDSS|nr:carbohydrate kinase family protein [Sediminispirochaeta smaragdinae]ADK83027.1 PfkB domain protein [Sediminispirochaeta smaragdinae DSM 11293]